MTDAGDILEELSGLLTRHGCIMAAKPEGFVLARVTAPGQAEAIAIVGMISAEGIEYKPCGREMRVKFQ
jgi:hypothetical protein